MKKITKFLLVPVALLLSSVMMSQVTTSSMTGRVTDDQGAVMGATVIATHQPSGTTYGTTTNDEGRYNLPGMRVGGPYKVEVTFIGYGKNTTNNIRKRMGGFSTIQVQGTSFNQELPMLWKIISRTEGYLHK